MAIDHAVTCLQLNFARLAPELRLRQDGQALIEYALIISLVALIAIVALRTTGTNIRGVLNTIAGEV